MSRQELIRGSKMFVEADSFDELKKNVDELKSEGFVLDGMYKRDKYTTTMPHWVLLKRK
jgi:hypothetical protein